MATMNFADTFARSFASGQQARTRKRQEEEAEEDRVIEKELLQHRLKEMRISEKIRARQAATENLGLLEGQPENTFRNATDEDMRTGGSQQVPGFAGGTMSMVPIRKPTVQIPGIEELGVPGISRQPQTLEEVLAQQISTARQKFLNTPQELSRGATLVDPLTKEVIGKGQEFPEPTVPYTTRDATGVETTERIPASEALRRGPAVKQPLPRRPSSSGGGAGDATSEDIDNYVAGVMSGNNPVDSIPKSELGVVIQGRLNKAGFNVTKAATDLRAFRTYLTGLNQGGQSKVLQAADEAGALLASLEEVYTRVGNRARIPGSAEARELEAAAAPLRNVLAIIKAGGNAPTNAALETAEKEFGVGLFSADLGPKIKRLKENLKYRTASIKGAFVPSSEVAGAPGGNGQVTAPTAAPAAPGVIEYEITLPDGTKQVRKVGG